MALLLVVVDSMPGDGLPVVGERSLTIRWVNSEVLVGMVAVGATGVVVTSVFSKKRVTLLGDWAPLVVDCSTVLIFVDEFSNPLVVVERNLSLDVVEKRDVVNLPDILV